MIYYKTAGKIAILFVLIILTSGKTFTQTNYVIVVKDMVSQQPLSGATVISLNSRFRHTSDSIGQIIIPLQVYTRSEKLQISIIGYKTALINAKPLVAQQ